MQGVVGGETERSRGNMRAVWPGSHAEELTLRVAAEVQALLSRRTQHIPDTHRQRVMVTTKSARGYSNSLQINQLCLPRARMPTCSGLLSPPKSSGSKSTLFQST